MRIDDIVNFYKEDGYDGTSSKITWENILNYLKDNCPLNTCSNCRPRSSQYHHKNEDPFFLLQQMEHNKTLLHYHFQSKHITGQDENEIQIVWWFLEHSIHAFASGSGSGGAGGGGRRTSSSIITRSNKDLLGIKDYYDKRPLHYLFEDSPLRYEDFTYSKYVDLFMEMSDEVMVIMPMMMMDCGEATTTNRITNTITTTTSTGGQEEGHDVTTNVSNRSASNDCCSSSCCCYWNEVMTQGNAWGSTPLHLIADNPYMDYKTVISVIEKCNQSWECHHHGMNDNRSMVKNWNGTNHCHPLLQPDKEGEIPLCYFFNTRTHLENVLLAEEDGDSDNNDDDDASHPHDNNKNCYALLIDAFLGFVDDDYKISYHGAFQAMFAFLELFCDWNGKSLYEMYQRNMWWSSEEQESKALEYFLCWKECMHSLDVPESFHESLVSSFCSPMCILLGAAFKCNLYYLNIEINSMSKDSVPALLGPLHHTISSQPVHLAASVANFPAFVLKLMLLLGLHDDPHILLQHDEHGRIPLHYALLTSNYSFHHEDEVGLPGCQHNSSLVYWNSEDYEPRSMVQFILDHEPNAANIPDVDGRLPIHLAIVYPWIDCMDYHCTFSSMKIPLEKVLAPIVYAAPNHISSIDPRTNLKPFLLAAATKDIILDAIYFLLRFDPSIMFR